MTMGRKSLKLERITEILDAFEYCLASKGLQSTTLEDIAVHAGMARRMVRHYVGNRDDLVAMGIKRIILKFNMTVLAIINKAPAEDRFEQALDYIFSDAFNALPATKLVAALLPVSLYDLSVKNAVKALYDTFHLGLYQEIKMVKQNADEEKCLQTAFSIMCLSFGGGWMQNIGFNAELNKQNKQLALSLVKRL